MSFASASHTTTTGTHIVRDTGVDALADRLGSTPVTLLAVWAHPDDESYLGGGMMAEIARRGGRVVSVTATLGEHGTTDPGTQPPIELAARRRAELTAALTTLGTDDGRLLGYADGTCDRVPVELGARRIGALLDELRPDVVLSFGPDGVTGHPDHRAVAHWTRRAVADRGDDTPLLTTAAGATWPTDLLEGMHRVDAFWPGYPSRTVDGPTWSVTLDGRDLDRKLDALACHASQVGPLQDALGEQDYRCLASLEAYGAANRAACRVLSDAPAALAA